MRNLHQYALMTGRVYLRTNSTRDSLVLYGDEPDSALVHAARVGVPDPCHLAKLKAFCQSGLAEKVIEKVEHYFLSGQ